MERREFLGASAAAAAGVMVAAPGSSAASPAGNGGGDAAGHYREAVRILEQAPLIDGHNDVPWQYRERVGNHLYRLDLRQDTSKLDPPMQTDIPRLRKGHLGGQFWSVYVSTDFSGPDAAKAQLEQLDIARRMIAHYDFFQLATTTDQVRQVCDRGRIASMLGMEGGHVIDNSLAALRMFYEAGARYLTLTHDKTTDWADSATDKPRHGGLNEFGRIVVREMNWLGMLVDLSHVHAMTMHDALDASKAPVIFSHSSARGVTDHPRNVPDDVLDRLPGNGGVVMVTFVPEYVTTGGPATLSDVADHIDYIRDRIGVQHIGIGSDFDGISRGPKGLEDVSTYPDLFAELLRRGYNPQELRQIAGANVLRVMRNVEDVSSMLQRKREASDVQFGDVTGSAPASAKLDRARLYEEETTSHARMPTAP